MPPCPLFLLSPRSAPARPRLVTTSLVRCRYAFQCRYRHEEISRRNHYERLGVRHDASPAEIKKSFYSLSKTHHPDVNRSDPSAAHIFSLISESYNILSDKSRRATYDRDVLRVHHHPQSHRPGASYHSSSPAGGRTASGLSRRKGTFRGPPPSFYRSGGWGSHSEKRRQAHEESTGSGNTESTDHKQGPWANPFGEQHGGMGPGDDPFGHHNEVPHFDKASHTRTHRREDQRRKERRERRAIGDDDIEFEPQASMTGHFFIISGILAATILAPLAYIQVMRLGRQKKER